MSSETHSFQTEVQQLLHLMIHSLYQHREVFLRELISNASDACDRLRFESLTDKSLLEDEIDPEIRVRCDTDARTVTITDNGIGMNRAEVIDNIGTIARSGTRRFMEALSGDDAKDAGLIGQFGVGFYSAFMVSDKVTLETRKAGTAPAEGVRWSSAGQGEYAIESLERAAHGTTITLHLREDAAEYADAARLRSVVAHYSDNISLPILMPEQDEKKKDEWERINKSAALWSRPKNEITDEEYNALYSTLAFDPEPPLLRLHNHVEGKLEYTSLFFIPAKAPFDLWDREHRHGIKLYVRRVFIMDDTKHLMPSYLRFVRGIVDSADLPLNVSREFLQHNREIDTIRNASVARILGELKKLAQSDEQKYAVFWKECGRALKEGIVEDADHRKALAELARFATTRGGEAQEVSLQTYVGRMPMKQKAIYYITADSHATASQSPHLEIFRKNDVEVLLLSDPIDEWLVNQLTEFEGKPLKSVSRGGLDLEESGAPENPKEAGKDEPRHADLVKAIAEALSGQVKEVRISKRLVDSPACLIADEHDPGGNLQRILEAVGQDAPVAKPILEINPDHALIRRLADHAEGIEDWAHVLFDQAALGEGAPLKEPASYVKRITRLMTDALSGPGA